MFFQEWNCEAAAFILRKPYIGMCSLWAYKQHTRKMFLSGTMWENSWRCATFQLSTSAPFFKSCLKKRDLLQCSHWLIIWGTHGLKLQHSNLKVGVFLVYHFVPTMTLRDGIIEWTKELDQTLPFTWWCSCFITKLLTFQWILNYWIQKKLKED